VPLQPSCIHCRCSPHVCTAAAVLLYTLPLQSSCIYNGGISNVTVTKTSHHTSVITPNRIGSHPPYPSKDDGGYDTIRVQVHSFRSGSPGDVTVGGAAPVHPSPSGARSRRGTPPAGPSDAYDWTRPEWWRYTPHCLLRGTAGRATILARCRPAEVPARRGAGSPRCRLAAGRDPSSVAGAPLESGAAPQGRARSSGARRGSRIRGRRVSRQLAGPPTPQSRARLGLPAAAADAAAL
jgi:hypothetical protein